MSHLIIFAAPRSGGGLLQESLLLDEGFVRSSLSDRKAYKEILEGPSVSRELSEEIAGHIRAGKSVVDYLPFYSSDVDLVRQMFPEARLLLVCRRPIDAMVSGVHAWESGKFVHWNQPEGWWGTPWSFGLTRNWESLIGRPTAEIVAEQYLGLSSSLIENFDGLDSKKAKKVTFEDLVANPESVLKELATFMGREFSTEFPQKLPQSSRSLAPLAPARRRGIISELSAALKDKAGPLENIKGHWTESLKDKALSEYKPVPEKPREIETKIVPSLGTPFSSAYSDSLVQLLKAAKATLAITTYKSGHLILASENKGSINTTFRSFVRPMGLAVSGGKLAVGTKDAIESFSNQPGLSKVVEPKGFFDAVFAPRNVIFTGDIAIHEMAYGLEGNKEELVFVNTSFSCLCKMDPNFSFVPIWRPKWISGLANEDRCHLNGLAMVQGKPKYVTALSQTDTAFGWRELKGTSGLILDIETDKIIVEGLSMPHSPRWYQDTLWVLVSGKGELCKVDVDSGKITTVATLPGFTRGLTFIGPYALVGLSQVRESVFKDLPVTETREERNAGVWIVDTRNGQLLGMLKFDGVVSEIFDVALIQNSTAATVISSSDLTSFAYTLPQEAMSDIMKPL